MDWDKVGNKRPALDGLDKYLDDFFSHPKRVLLLLVIAVAAIGAYTCWYTIQTDQRGVVMRLGRYHRSSDPGLHFKIPFGIESVIKVRTTIINEEAFGFSLPGGRTEVVQQAWGLGQEQWRRPARNFREESTMLTGDLNVADVRWVVQYRVADPRNYLFKVREPEKNIRDISQAIMRRVVGDRTVDQVLTVGRVEIAAEAKRLTQEILDLYEMGIQIADVKLQDINPPERVRPSFNDVVAAKQQQEQAINIAKKEYNSAIPEARGLAEQVVSQAQGYAVALVNRAEGDANKFRQVLEEYRGAPEITKTRLYLEAVEKLLQRLERVTVIDPEIRGVLPVFGQTVLPDKASQPASDRAIPAPKMEARR